MLQYGLVARAPPLLYGLPAEDRIEEKDRDKHEGDFGFKPLMPTLELARNLFASDETAGLAARPRGEHALPHEPGCLILF